MVKSPVTMCLIAVHMAVFLRAGPLDHLLPPSDSVCFQDIGAKQLFLSSLFHSSKFHLMYDIFSLLRTCAPLEAIMGSTHFTFTIIILQFLSHILRFWVTNWTGVGIYLLDGSNCNLGFSGTLFALRVVLQNRSSKRSIFGWFLPLGFVTCVELLLPPIFVRGIPLTSQLSGFVAGTIYVYVCLILHYGLGFMFILGRILLLFLSPFIAIIRGLIVKRKRRRDDGKTARNAWPQSDSRLAGGNDEEEINLIWQCEGCWEKMGVFLTKCEACGHPRF